MSTEYLLVPFSSVSFIAVLQFSMCKSFHQLNLLAIFRNSTSTFNLEKLQTQQSGSILTLTSHKTDFSKFTCELKIEKSIKLFHFTERALLFIRRSRKQRTSFYWKNKQNLQYIIMYIPNHKVRGLLRKKIGVNIKYEQNYFFY